MPAVNDGERAEEDPAGFAEQYPGLDAAFESIGATTMLRLTSQLDGPPDLDAWFEFGLQRTLDGVELLVKPSAT